MSARFCLIGLMLCPGIFSQVARQANLEYATPKKRSLAAGEMDHPKRPQIEQTSRLIAAFGIRPGDTVADVGTGVGYLLPYLVQATGQRGRVFAVDIYPDFLARADQRIQRHGWTNVSTILGTERDPKLPANAVDLAVIVDTYHHLDYPVDMLRCIRRSLKPQGRLMIVDFYNSRPHPAATAEGLKVHVRADRDDVIREVTAAGYVLARSFDHFSYEYVLAFRRQ